MTQELSSAQRKPVLDEGSFQQLLAAAYVVQVHNDRLVVRKRKPDGTHTLSEIAETQRLIQTQQLDLQAATQLIAERLQQITNASGIAIGIVEGDELIYRAATGSAANETGSRVPINSVLSANCLSSGQILQCSNVKKDSVLSAELCRELGVKSLVAAPVYHKGKVAGVLELRSAKTNAFVEHDVRTSQLMAGLVTEAIAGAAELEWKQELAAERASMLEVLDKIKPQLERLVAEPTAVAAPPLEALPPAAPLKPPVVSTGELPKRESPDPHCSGCGHRFEEGEFFCGICGAARSEKTSGNDIESKWASLLQQAAERREKESSVQEPEDVADDLPNETPRFLLPAALEETVVQVEDKAKQEEQGSPVDEREAPAPESTLSQATAMSSRSLDEILARFSTPEPSATVAKSDLTTKGEADSATDTEVPPQKSPSAASTLSGITQTSVWTLALKARAWLESLKAPQPVWPEFWRRHRANIYLGIAAVILQIVILLLVFPGEGARPAPSGDSKGSGNAASTVKDQRRKNPPQPNLTFFEKLLVSVGLAEPPSMPVYLGNPSIQVWVDVHTALYYCPGSDLYGKTPGGKFTSQRDAQQDQFEPANRKACD